MTTKAQRQRWADRVGAMAIYQEMTLNMEISRKSHPFLINRAKYTLADLKALEVELEAEEKPDA